MISLSTWLMATKATSTVQARMMYVLIPSLLDTSKPTTTRGPSSHLFIAKAACEDNNKEDLLMPRHLIPVAQR